MLSPSLRSFLGLVSAGASSHSPGCPSGGAAEEAAVMVGLRQIGVNRLLAKYSRSCVARASPNGSNPAIPQLGAEAVCVRHFGYDGSVAALTQLRRRILCRRSGGNQAVS